MSVMLYTFFGRGRILASLPIARYQAYAMHTHQASAESELIRRDMFTFSRATYTALSLRAIHYGDGECDFGASCQRQPDNALIIEKWH